VAKIRNADVASPDVFLACADPARDEACGMIAAYLRRGGFRVFRSGEVDCPEDQRLAMVEEAPDFVIVVSPAGFPVLADPSRSVAGELERALATSRNVVRVWMAGDPAGLPDELPDAIRRPLGAQQSLVFDPDRLAESLSMIQHALSSDSIIADRFLMRRVKRLFLFAALVVLAGFSLQTAPQLWKRWNRPRPLPPVAPFALSWSAFGERVGRDGPVEISVAEGAEILPGDRIRVMFSPSAAGSAYVVARDRQGRISVLFPTDAIRGASRVRAGEAYHAPVDGGWLTVDAQSGLDTVYVFAGYDPLQNLEELIEEPETASNQGERRQLVEQTLNGLLDGRHYQYGRRVWIRTTQLVDQGLKSPPGPASFTVTLPGGASARHPAMVQPGLVSAVAEIKVAFGPGQGGRR
jgi:hypothetical protein